MSKSNRKHRTESLPHLERKARLAYERYTAASDAVLKHPQTAARKAAEKARAAEPEFASVIDGILQSLRGAEEVALIVCGAIKATDTTDGHAAAHVLMSGCANELTEQIGQLERAVQNARIRGSRMVVVQEDSAGTSEAQQ